MAKRTKAQQTEYDEAIAQLREWIKPGDTVYTVLRHVSRSGMSRHISVVLLQPNAEDPARPIDLHPNYYTSIVTGYPLVRSGASDAIKIGGCGMDMGFQLVYQLSQALYGDGYACLGKGKCPSSYHVNHRDQVRCAGTRVYNPDGPDTGQYCYKPDRYLFRDRSEVPPDWPELPPIAIGDGETVSAGYAACITDENGEHPQVCPTCQGAGWLPNPDGPERFDLVHTDGYAIRHRWL